MGFFTEQATENAQLIISKAKGEVDKDALIARLEKSMVNNAMKEGLRFMEDPKSDYHAFRFFAGNHGVGVGVFQVDDSKMKYKVSKCFCIPDDFDGGKGWNDEFALSLLGMRLFTDEWDPMEFPVKVEIRVVAQAMHLDLLNKAFKGDPKIPFFLKRFVWKGGMESMFRAKRISK